MEQEQSTSTAEAVENRPSELVRPVEGRMVAGVAVGLANRYGLTPWILRAGFILLSFFGGLGLALYAAGWAVIRSVDETQSPAERFFGNTSSPASWVGIGLIFLAALVLLDNLTFLSGAVIWAGALLVVGVLLYMGHIPSRSGARGDDKEGVQQMTTDTMNPTTQAGVSPAGPGDTPPPGAPAPREPVPPAPPRERSVLGRLTLGLMILGLGVLALLDNLDGVPIEATPRHYLALAVTVIGVGLLVGAVWGRARWLILIAVLMIPTLLFSPVFEYDWASDRFNVVHAPTTFQDVREVYSIDVGNLVIDLTDLDWDGEQISVLAQVDAGNLEILIPAGVAVSGTATVDVGRAGAFGQEAVGLGNPNISFDVDGDEGSIVIEALVDVGNIEIRNG